MIEEYVGDTFKNVIDDFLENIEYFKTFMEENKPKVVYVKIRHKKKKFKIRKMISYNPIVEIIPSYPITLFRRLIERKEQE